MQEIPCGAADADGPAGASAPPQARERFDARGCGEFQGLQRHSLALAAGSLGNEEQTSEFAAGPAASDYWSSRLSMTTLAPMPIGGALNIAVNGTW